MLMIGVRVLTFEGKSCSVFSGHLPGEKMIAQTAHFPGVSPEALYTAYLSSKEHSAMTAGSRPASFFRPGFLLIEGETISESAVC